MGCCLSTPNASPPASPYRQPTQPPTGASSRAHLASATTPRLSATPSHNERPNLPLQFPPPIPKSPALPASPTLARSYSSPSSAGWTHRRLAHERAAFFDTRVTGRAEIWGAVRVASEMLRAGDTEGAGGVLEAVGCTCPTGRIDSASEGLDVRRPGRRRRERDGGGGVFDERGESYVVPSWVVRDPEDVVPDPEEESEVEDGDEKADAEVEKGKGREEDSVEVRCRLSDRGTDVVVSVGKSQPVRLLVKRIVETSEIPTATTVRIAYLGRVLVDSESLDAQGWTEGHVVNVLVFTP